MNDSLLGVTVGVGVIVGVTDTVGVTVGVGVGEFVAVIDGVGVGVAQVVVAGAFNLTTPLYGFV